MQYGNPDEDRFYEVRGVKPPERIPHLTEEEIERKLEANRSARRCVYRQKGPDVYCITCPYRHGNRVRPDMLLHGTDAQGLPILKRL